MQAVNSGNNLWCCLPVWQNTSRFRLDQPRHCHLQLMERCTCRELSGMSVHLCSGEVNGNVWPDRYGRGYIRRKGDTVSADTSKGSGGPM